VRVVPSIVSGVLEPGFMHHPITWLRSARRDRQRLAMMMQVIEQMLGRKIDLEPRVSYGESLGMERIGNAERALQVIIDSARQLMQSHIAWSA
jgi:hypothetical protein